MRITPLEAGDAHDDGRAIRAQTAMFSPGRIHGAATLGCDTASSLGAQGAQPNSIAQAGPVSAWNSCCYVLLAAN